MKVQNDYLVVLDLDGTIIDSEWAHEKAKKTIMAELGGQCDINLQNYTGRSNHVFWSDVLEKMGIEGDIDELVRKQFARVIEELNCAQQPEMPGLTTLLKHLKQNDYCTAVCSGSERYFVLQILQHLNVEKYFDHVITGSDVQNLKPAPDIYLAAASEAQISSENILAIEDSQSGCTAVHAAGMRCVGFTDEGRNQQNLEKADYKVARLDQVIDIVEGLR